MTRAGAKARRTMKRVLRVVGNRRSARRKYEIVRLPAGSGLDICTAMFLFESRRRSSLATAGVGGGMREDSWVAGGGRSSVELQCGGRSHHELPSVRRAAAGGNDTKVALVDGASSASCLILGASARANVRRSGAVGLQRVNELQQRMRDNRRRNPESNALDRGLPISVTELSWPESDVVVGGESPPAASIP